MRKWMVEFLSKSQSRFIKIARVNSIRMTNLTIYANFLRAVPRDDIIESTRFLMRPPVIIPPWENVLEDNAWVTKKNHSDSCRPAWLEIDRKVCPTTTTS